MEEEQQETQKPEEKRGAGVVIIVSVLVAVYFLFPSIYLYPVYLAYKSSPAPKSVDTALTIFFYPVKKLADAFPAYEKMLEWEDGLLGLPH